mmetsp:Transcript_35520/g.92583  ORF Transcript_35520/g.92583 Transcript_35520/m.92583 type:complete len:210 (-) Transcript_35520:608-1237(-)
MLLSPPFGRRRESGRKYAVKPSHHFIYCSNTGSVSILFFCSISFCLSFVRLSPFSYHASVLTLPSQWLFTLFVVHVFTVFLLSFCSINWLSLLPFKRRVTRGKRRGQMARCERVKVGAVSLFFLCVHPNTIRDKGTTVLPCIVGLRKSDFPFVLAVATLSLFSFFFSLFTLPAHAPHSKGDGRTLQQAGRSRCKILYDSAYSTLTKWGF